MPIRGDSVAIVSGGMDSVTLAHYVVKKQNRSPLILSFDYGQRHRRELLCAAQCAADLGLYHLTVNIGFYAHLNMATALLADSVEDVPNISDVMGDPQPITYVPNRNMVMLSIAAALAEGINASDVIFGAQLHDQYGYWDTTKAFVDRLQQLFNLNRKNMIRLVAPFVNWSKADELRLGLELGIDYGKTWSCYVGEELACGTCPTCAERRAAFEKCGLVDPIPYAQ